MLAAFVSLGADFGAKEGLVRTLSSERSTKRAAVIISGHLRDACDDHEHLLRQRHDCMGVFAACDVFLCTWDTVQIPTKTWRNVSAYSTASAFTCSSTIAKALGASVLVIDTQHTDATESNGTECGQQPCWGQTGVAIDGMRFMARSLATCAEQIVLHTESPTSTTYSEIFRIRPEKRHALSLEDWQSKMPTNSKAIVAKASSLFNSIDNAFWGNTKAMLTLLRAYKEEQMQVYRTTPLKHVIKIHPEATLAYVADRHNITFRLSSGTMQSARPVDIYNGKHVYMGSLQQPPPK